MEEKYQCCICKKYFKKENILGNYENATCDTCWGKYIKE